MPQAFYAKEPKGVSLESPGNYRFITTEKAKSGQMSSTEECIAS
jgi:hypothetical protein